VEHVKDSSLSTLRNKKGCTFLWDILFQDLVCTQMMLRSPSDIYIPDYSIQILLRKLKVGQVLE
jgi:hypothetical protein